MSGAVLNSGFFTTVLTSFEKDFERVLVRAKEGHFEDSLWTDNVDFVPICYSQCDFFWLLHL